MPFLFSHATQNMSPRVGPEFMGQCTSCGEFGFTLCAKDAYETKSECRTALYSNIRSLVKRVVAEKAAKGEAVNSEQEELMVESTVKAGRTLCLPDTVDPRGPKGK